MTLGPLFDGKGRAPSPAVTHALLAIIESFQHPDAQPGNCGLFSRLPDTERTRGLRTELRRYLLERLGLSDRNGVFAEWMAGKTTAEVVAALSDAAGKTGAMTTRVVNLRREKFDVYIGRAGKGQDGYFGNPIALDPKRPRSEQAHVLEEFRAYFLNRVERDAEFRRRALALKGKTLGCFCKPASCHGDVIAAWVEENAQ